MLLFLKYIFIFNQLMLDSHLVVRDCGLCLFFMISSLHATCCQLFRTTLCFDGLYTLLISDE